MDFPGLSLDLSSLAGTSRPDPNALYDMLIIGGGPGAMTAAVYAARKTLSVALIAGDFGGQVATTTDIENYLGFQVITGKELTDRFVEQVQHFKIPTAKGDKVEKISQEGEIFVARTDKQESFRARTVILSTGKRNRHLNVPGEQELVGRGVAYCAICDAPLYKQKKVAVIGGGNSAFTAALDLLKLEATVVLLNFSAGWQADEVLVAAVKRYSDKLRLLSEQQVIRIEGKDRVEAIHILDRNTQAEERLLVNGIFIEIGLLPNSELVQDLVQLNEQGEVIVDCHCRTNVPGFFGAGDVTNVPHKQIVISAGEGAKAALTAYDYLVGKGLV